MDGRADVLRAGAVLVAGARGKGTARRYFVGVGDPQATIQNRVTG
jgi:hypothetical protein